MNITSLNIGKIKRYDWRGGTDSALFKSPVAEDTLLNNMGLEGDYQANLKNHGGIDKAILIIPETNYSLLGVQQPFGYLGENITLSEIDETQVSLGDKFQIGNVILEVSQPRNPCWKLNALSGNDTLLKRYAESGHVGFYCRVLQKGNLKVGDKVIHISCNDKSPINIKSLFLAKHYHQNEEQITLLQRALQHSALSESWKANIKTALSMSEPPF